MLMKRGLRNAPLSIVLIVFCFLLACTTSTTNAPKYSNFNSEMSLSEGSTESLTLADQRNEFQSLRSSLDVWKAANLHDYDYEITWDADGNNPPTSPVIVQVRGGKNHSVTAASKSNNYGLEVYQSYNTIEKVFEQVESMIESGKDVRVKYNAQYGYPEQILSASRPVAADGIFVINIGKFKSIFENE